MRYGDLKGRTRKFALDIIRLVEALPSDRTCKILGVQLLDRKVFAMPNSRSALECSYSAFRIPHSAL